MGQLVSSLSLDLASDHVIRVSRLPDPMALASTVPGYFVSEMAEVAADTEGVLQKLVQARCADDYALAVIDDAGLLIGLGKRSKETGVSVVEWLASKPKGGVVLVNRAFQELQVPPEDLAAMLDQLRRRRDLARSLMVGGTNLWDLAHKYLARPYRELFGVRSLQLGMALLLGATTFWQLNHTAHS